MQGDDTVKRFTVITTASLGGTVSLGWLSSARMGWDVAAIPPRLPGNPVDLCVPSLDSDSLALFRLASNGTVIQGSVELIEDGVGGIPSNTI